MLTRIAASTLLLLSLAVVATAQEPVQEPVPEPAAESESEPQPASEPTEPPTVDDLPAPSSGDQEEIERLEAELLRSRLEAKGSELTDLEANRLERGGAPNPDPNRVQPGLEEWVSPLFGLRPTRIAPGGEGVVHLVVMLMRDSVIQAGAPLRVKFAEYQGPLSFGSWSIDPPPLGELPTRFQGRPVYDNTAIIKIPVRVDSAAAYGKYPMALDLEIQVSEGQSGEVRGIFQAALATKIEVGDPVPRPAVQQSDVVDDGSLPPARQPDDGPAGWAPGDAVAATPSGAEAAESRPEGAAVVSGGRTDVPAQAGDRGSSSGAAGADLLPDEPEGLPWIWLLGGALLLGILALLLSRLGRS